MSTKTIESTEKAAKQEMAHKYRGARWSNLRMMAEPGDLLFGTEVSPKEIRIRGSHNRIFPIAFLVLMSTSLFY